LINLSGENIYLKGILIVFILMLYDFLKKKFIPYLNKKHNKMDGLSSKILIKSILILMMVKDSKNYFANNLGLFVIFLMNSYIIVDLLIKQFRGIKIFIKKIKIMFFVKLNKLKIHEKGRLYIK
jgi:hypothetical protein